MMLKPPPVAPVAHLLKTGATLLHQRTEGAPRLALSIFIPGGNQFDAVPGFSDLVDRLLMKGTVTRSQEQLSIDIDGLTLEMDTDTKRDFSLLSATLLEEDLEASLELMADVFYNATFDEFEKEKEKVIGEIHMDLDSPRNRASDQFVRELFHGTPYNSVGSLILENLPQLDAVDKLAAHYHAAYRPERVIFSLAGDVREERVIPLLEPYFPPRKEPATPLALDAADKLRSLTVAENRIITTPRDDISQAHIFQGWLMPAANHPDYPAILALNTILGGAGLSSRLFLELRDKQGLAYTVRSAFEAYQHRGLFYLYIGTEASNKAKCLQGFAVECGKLIQDAVSSRELDEAKQNILGRRTIFLETASQQASYLGANAILGRSLEDILTFPDRLQAVTPADVQRVAQTYLTQPSVVSIVAPSSAL